MEEKVAIPSFGIYTGEGGKCHSTHSFLGGRTRQLIDGRVDLHGRLLTSDFTLGFSHYMQHGRGDSRKGSVFQVDGKISVQAMSIYIGICINGDPVAYLAHVTQSVLFVTSGSSHVSTGRSPLFQNPRCLARPTPFIFIEPISPDVNE